MLTVKQTEPLYRGALFPEGPDSTKASSDLLRLITKAQWATLAKWSYMWDRNVRDILISMRPMFEQEEYSSDKCRIVGIFPHTRLYGCISSDGSTHT
jgi:hypothetical protein